MKSIPFPTDFYSYIIPPNKDHLLKICESAPKVRDQSFVWGSKSISDKVRLNHNGLLEALEPSLKIFWDELDMSPPNQIKILEGWKNIYKKGYHQELHYHPSCDVSCVIFLDDYKEGQSKFYFSNRHSCEPTSIWGKIINTNSWYMYPERGSLIFFPSHMLHGVTPHNLNEERKTIALNFDIVIR
tara:strand:- start:89 stop:643 length:555 start_codon:yes stop_codon:yes gene_type:complete